MTHQLYGSNFSLHHIFLKFQKNLAVFFQISNPEIRNAVIDRRNSIDVSFSCAFPIHLNVSLSEAIESRKVEIELILEEKIVELDVVMGVYNKEYSEAIESGHVYNVPEPIYIGMEFDDDLSEDDSSFALAPKTCWATPR